MKTAQFWDKTHPLSLLSEALYAELVPSFGRAATPHGELLRSMGRLYTDLYNNGFGNEEVLQRELTVVWSHKSDLEPYLEDPQSWTRSLEVMLSEFGSRVRKDEEDKDTENLGVKIEDITTAVVKYVALAAGKTLPQPMEVQEPCAI